jgi:hypothetical protein
MERRADSNRRTSDIGPEITWRGDTVDSSPPSIQMPCPHTVRPSSSTPVLTEHLLLKRAINYWPTPRHIEYTTLAARLQSYEKAWPFPADQTREALSHAGVFYAGTFTSISFYSHANYLFVRDITFSLPLSTFFQVRVIEQRASFVG